MDCAVFVYGVLTFPEIFEALTGQRFEIELAILDGYARLAVAGRVYPAIVRKLHSQVDGYLIKNVNTQTLKIIDGFEGSEYKRENITVNTEQRQHAAAAYIWNKDPKLLRGAWDLEEFYNGHLQEYLQRLKTKQQNSV